MRIPVCAVAMLAGIFAVHAWAQTQPQTPLQVNGVTDGGYIVLNSGTEGQPYSYQFTATGGTPPYIWSVGPGGDDSDFIGLPAGLTLNPQTGLLSGTPTVQIPRTSYFLLTLSDSSTYSEPVFVQVGIKIFPPLPLTIQNSLPAGTAGAFYSGTIQATGGVPPYTLVVTGLPSGLSFTSASGVVSGTEQNAGIYPISVTVADHAAETVSQSVNLQFFAPAALGAAGATTSATVDLPSTLTLAASGGNPPYTWTLVSGTLPPGMMLHAAGYIDGSPSVVGPYQFSVQATDAEGRTATATYTIQVTQAPPTPTTTSLPLGYVNIPYQQQILNVAGGTPPYTFTLQSGSTLPPGLTLSGGVITGIPTSAAAGQQFTIVATDSSTPAISVPITFTLTIAGQPVNADLTLNTASLSFTTNAGAQLAPQPGNIVVQSTDASASPTFSLSVSPAAPWLEPLPSSGTTPDSIAVGINAAALPPAAATPYTTAISITCPTCSPATQTVSVSLLVMGTPGTVLVPEQIVSFVAAGPTPKLSGSITVQNTGGGSLGIGEVVCGAPWCSVGSYGYTVPGGSSMTVPITVDPSMVTPGFYRTSVTVNSSGGNISVPVDLLYTNGALLSLNPAAVRFDMDAGSAPPQPNSSFSIQIPQGSGITWTAQVLPGAPWLQLATPSGMATPNTPGVVNYSIVPSAGGATLGVGAYYGTIRVTASGVANSPFDFEVVLNVNPAGDETEVDPEPAGVVFVTAPGVDPPDQGVSVYTTSPQSIPYSCAVTSGKLNWLSVSQPVNPISVTSPGDSDMGVAAGTLTPGVYSSGVTYSVSGGQARTVNVTLVVQPVPAGGGTDGAGSGSAKGRSTAAASVAACAPTQLVPTQTGLVSNFSAPAAWPTPLSILLLDNCGNAVSNGQVVTTFSNGDPPLALPLVDANQGLYSATWTPHTPGSQVDVLATANASGFQQATALITGAVPPNAVPLIAPNGAVHPFDPEAGGPLAPGGIIAIYGSNLSAQTGQPSTIPLPTSFNNTSVIVGGMLAPLFYVSPSQINAQIPYQLSSGSQYQVIVTANGAISAPQPIELTPVSPGIAAYTDGTAIAQHNADGSLVSASSPGTPGEYLVIYLLGLGDTTTPVTTGAASPSAPPAQASDAPTLLLNGNSIPVAFAGLTPGLVGLYQMDFQIPVGLAAGTYSLQVTQGSLASNTVTFPVGP